MGRTTKRESICFSSFTILSFIGEGFLAPPLTPPHLIHEVKRLSISLGFSFWWGCEEWCGKGFIGYDDLPIKTYLTVRFA